jgi:SAM-dependent methyltransferase
MLTHFFFCFHARAALAKRKTLEEIDIHSVDASSDNELGHEAIKDHFADAYNNVADKSSSRGNAKIASILMKKLGYTDEEMRIIGSDANLMQGTGNPHIAANIQVGEVVVDLGSGFGVDAFVAADKVGESGKIIGIDISRSEVDISQKRSIDRGLENIVTFREGDIEDIPLRDSYADCVISNGGFCLVPDKIKAFTEIFRVLKTGGRMSICCTTNRVELPKDVDWPVCMNVFMKLNDIEPMLKKIGFTDIEFDKSILISVNPIFFSIGSISFNFINTFIHTGQSTSLGNSTRLVVQHIDIRPPGFRTLKISVKALILSGTKQKPPFEITQSA